MVDCSDCCTLLVDYERGELDAARDAAMHAHLHDCAGCRARWEADLELVASVRTALAEREFPPSILAGVRQAMRAEAPPSFLARLRLIVRPVVAAPLAAAVLIAGIFVGYERTKTPQPALTGMQFVREHVAQTAGMTSSERTWATYVLTSANGGDGANAGTASGQ